MSGSDARLAALLTDRSARLASRNDNQVDDAMWTMLGIAVQRARREVAESTQPDAADNFMASVILNFFIPCARESYTAEQITSFVESALGWDPPIDVE